jgi:hypothetical protein
VSTIKETDKNIEKRKKRKGRIWGKRKEQETERT